MKNLLVIIDMVNGFVNFGALADKNINKVTPNIIKLIEKAKDKNYHIVAFKDCHSLLDSEFKTYPVHCLKGTSESELIDELKVYENEMQLIEKNTTNGFITKDFQNIVKNIKIDNVYVSGCCTDICVQDFVTSYLKYIKENNLKTKIYVVDDACYTFNNENHNASLMHKNAIEKMKELGAIIVNYQKSREIV